MKHHHETEIKLQVQNPRALKRRLGELGFRPVQARHFESNHLFDFPDLRLRKARCLLRLRFAGGQGILTFKGAPLSSRSYKVRGEIETGVEDGNRLREILEGLGFHETFRYEKYRTVYARNVKRGRAERSVLVYDETPIGNYVELEGPAGWIDEVARQLGYERGDYITASYAALYFKKCAERGEEPGSMFFRPHKS